MSLAPCREPAGFRSTLPHGERHAAQTHSSPTPRFDPRSRTGSDALTGGSGTSWPRFRSTLPHGERPAAFRLAGVIACFDPRSRTGSDRVGDALGAIRNDGFDPRSRTGSDALRPPHHAGTMRFDPRSRTGSDQDFDNFGGLFVVSIHAPARGATWSPGPRLVSSEFRSTLPHGERRAASRHRHRCPRRFDPRSRTGSDRPGHGALPAGTGFDPRSRTGSDPYTRFMRNTGVVFRSTLPHGERPRQASRWTRPACFDPRSRTGSDSGWG